MAQEKSSLYPLYDPDYDDIKAEEESRRLADRDGRIILIIGTILSLIYVFGYLPYH